MARVQDASSRHVPAESRSSWPQMDARVAAVLWSICVAMAGLIVIGAVVSNV
ncbi:hypothetical protein [Rhizobium tubonense]|uniref:hypothetical protein n=1 Tax=Rhizobium tubonense TaxID=484088 RepID=UPI0012B68C24|nr:hypothetical protein [Rhizobium tubonense]